MAVNNAAIILLCIFAFSSTLVLGDPISYDVCKGGSKSVIKSVDIEPYKTDRQGRYIFKKGTNVTATVIFTPEVMFTEGTVHLSAQFAGSWLELPVPQPNACKDHKITCPLKPGVEYTMVGKIVVMKHLPALPFRVRLDVKLPNENYLYCFEMLVRIVS